MSPNPVRVLLTLVSFVLPCTAQIALGTPFLVGNEAGADQSPSVAFDFDGQRYLVVWSVETGVVTADLHGQFVSPTGTLIGSDFVIDTSIDRLVKPSVAHVREDDKFLVGYHRRYTPAPPGIADQRWLVRSIAGSGTVSSRVTVPFDATTTGTPSEIVVGGDARVGPSGLFQPRGLVVVRRGTASGNNVAVAIADVGGTNPLLSPFVDMVSQIDRVGDIAVVANGQVGWLVVWCESDTTLANYNTIRGRLIDAGGQMCQATYTLHDGLVAVSDPSVAMRDLFELAIVWRSGDDLVARTLSWNGSCGVSGMQVGPSATVAVGSSSQPALAFARDKWLLAYRRSVGTGSIVVAKRLDLTSCIPCSQEWPVDGAAGAQTTPAVSSHWNGGGLTSDEAIAVWSDGTVRASRFAMSGNDVVVSLGGGCAGPGNFAMHQGECVIGNPNFQLLVAGPTAPVAALVVGFSQLGVTCGSCTLVPSPDALLPGTNPTTLPIPCDPLLVGVDLYTQWLVLQPSDCPLLPDFSLTNALRFTIGE